MSLVISGKREVLWDKGWPTLDRMKIKSYCFVGAQPGFAMGEGT